MPVAPAQRTLLARRIQERHWTVEEFTEQFNRTARGTLPDGRDHAISLGQAKRWVTGQCGHPLPASRRVLETMFTTDTHTLLSPPERDPARTPPAAIAHRPRAGDDEHATPAASPSLAG